MREMNFFFLCHAFNRGKKASNVSLEPFHTIQLFEAISIQIKGDDKKEKESSCL